MPMIPMKEHYYVLDNHTHFEKIVIDILDISEVDISISVSIPTSKYRALKEPNRKNTK